ncbi:MAG: cytochrome c biogenesis protein CcsA [Deltaproteobacteria bacterium]
MYEQLASAALYFSLVAYSTAATLYFVDLARREYNPDGNLYASRVLWVGAIIHALQIGIASFATNTCPVESLPFALNLSALLTVAMYILIRRRWRVDAMGVAVVPIALAFVVGGQFVGTGPTVETLPRGLLAVHIASNLMGLGLFLLAGAAGAFYIVQERRLKAKRMPSRLPALDALDSTEHRLLLAGFPLQTLGAISGAAFLADLHMSQAQLLQVILAYGTWVLIATVLLLRAILGWHGRRTAYGTVAGAACVMLVLFLYILRGTGA